MTGTPFLLVLLVALINNTSAMEAFRDRFIEFMRMAAEVGCAGYVNKDIEVGLHACLKQYLPKEFDDEAEEILKLRSLYCDNGKPIHNKIEEDIQKAFNEEPKFKEYLKKMYIEHVEAFMNLEKCLRDDELQGQVKAQTAAPA